MNSITRTIVTATILSLILSGCLNILPKYQEMEWYIQPDGTVLIKDHLYDLYYAGSSTSSAIKTFVKFVEEMEPPILTPAPSEDDTNVFIRLRELQDKYGGLNWLQEVEVPFKEIVKGFDIETADGFYWILFDTNSVTIETNGQTITHPDETKKLIVRWPTNTTYFWFKQTSKCGDEEISLVEFWREYCAVGRDITMLTNKLSRTD